MGALRYRDDWEEARARLTRWWNGEDIGRAAMQITAPRSQPIEDIPAIPEPEGWTSWYSTKSLPYRINLALRACVNTYYLGEAVPYYASGDLAPNCLALFLGCKGREMPGTVWCEPLIEDPETARFEYDPENFYWKFSREVYRQVIAQSKGKFLQQFPDFIEGLDTLSAMRGNAKLLEDLIFRPDWVHTCLRQITDRYFHYYDILYDQLRDEVGGSVFWAWAPGRMAKFQCDFSTMISPAMFREFMAPVLTEMTERVSYSMYHWDGPGAIVHHDALLSIPRLNMLQWTPGAGVEQDCHPRWYPLYHKTIEAGKKLLLWASGGKEDLLQMKREFGEGARQIMFNVSVGTPEEAEECIRLMEL